jgi:Ca-activated chloride channel family protein
MRLDKDDPRLTAYLLGELSDDDRAELEQCEQSRALVEELGKVTEQLMAWGQSEPDADAGLSDDRRAAIEDRLAAPAVDKSEQEDNEQRDDRQQSGDEPKNAGEDKKVVDIKTRRRRRVVMVAVITGVAASVAGMVTLIGVSKDKPAEMAHKSVAVGDVPTVQLSLEQKNTNVAIDSSRVKGTDGRYRTLTLARGKYKMVVKKPGYGDIQKDENEKVGDKTDKGASVAFSIKPPVHARPTGVKPIIASNDRGLRVRTGERTRRDGYATTTVRGPVYENPFYSVAQRALSTFSIDVDTAGYVNVRQRLSLNQLPHPSVVRIEELVNYFDYRYAQPKDDRPFAVHTALSGAPWNPRHQLLRVALAGKNMALSKRPPSNLVFLVDVSGSMFDQKKLPLLRRALSMLVRRLGENDRVALVVYAGASGLVLDSTPCTPSKRKVILSAIERLTSGGSTNGGAGIRLAYDVATKNAIKGGVNRVILATDGDFNVGTTNSRELITLVRRKAKKEHVFLTVLGFGQRINDRLLEQISNKGNGSYAYIDSLREARKVLVDKLSGTLVTIAKDVKIQIEFNPRHVAGYRLIGYENRRMAAKDFANDKKDAGEIGAGHTVTALYELVPAGQKVPGKLPLKYQSAQPNKTATDELLTVKLRYKKPTGSRSTLIELPMKKPERVRSLFRQDADFRLAAAVGWFGMVLRRSRHAGEHKDPLAKVAALVERSIGNDKSGDRKELLTLVRKARKLMAAGAVGY